MSEKSRKLSEETQTELIRLLKMRFDSNMKRHPELDWSNIQGRLEAAPEKLWSLHEMERTGGEPDVTGLNQDSGEYIFCDCSTETPAERRSLCYDREALDSRKENKPLGSAVGMAEEMGIDILTEAEYRDLQKSGVYDIKTSSWVRTPDHVRKLGGAFFCDRRYDTVFVYHNGAQSYYSSRGFRGSLRV